MITVTDIRKLAFTFNEVTESPHFQKTSYRFKGKIFATVSIVTKQAMLRLPLIQQSVFHSADPLGIYPVPGAWGRKGATYFDLSIVKEAMFSEAMQLSYNLVSGGPFKKK